VPYRPKIEGPNILTPDELRAVLEATGKPRKDDT